MTIGQTAAGIGGATPAPVGRNPILQAGRELVDAEPKTVSWFAIKIGPSTYGIFDTFADDSGRDAHLTGKVAQALMEKADELLAKSPSIEKIDVIASKLPK